MSMSKNFIISLSKPTSVVAHCLKALYLIFIYSFVVLDLRFSSEVL